MLDAGGDVMAGVPDSPPGEGGPAPQPEPAAAAAPAETAQAAPGKRKRGRPPGSKTRNRKAPQAAPAAPGAASAAPAAPAPAVNWQQVTHVSLQMVATFTNDTRWEVVRQVHGDQLAKVMADLATAYGWKPTVDPRVAASMQAMFVGGAIYATWSKLPAPEKPAAEQPPAHPPAPPPSDPDEDDAQIASWSAPEPSNAAPAGGESAPVGGDQ